MNLKQIVSKPPIRKMKMCIWYLLMLLFCKQAVAQTTIGNTPIRPIVMRIIKNIAKENRLEGAVVGIAGVKSAQWERFKELQNKATNLELQTLTDYPNAVVRCYAFHAMTLRKDTDIFPVLLTHLQDTAQVSTLSFDLGGSQMVGDYFIEVVTPNFVDEQAYKLSIYQKAKLDSALLYDKHVNLAGKYRLLRELRPLPEHYDRIKEIVITEANPVAVLALSRFRNLNDTSIISTYLQKPNMLYYAVYSIREFPNAIFYPKLVQVFEKEWERKAYNYPLWRILYQALAQYPTQQTLELFERTVQSKDQFRNQTLGVFLAIALTKYPNPLFQSTKSKIKLDTYHTEDVAYQMNAEK